MPIKAADRFITAVNVVLKNEGGLEDNPADPGGITNYGISLRFMQEENIDMNNDGHIDAIDAEDVKALTKDDAIKIYKHFWWDKYHYDDISDIKIATKVFDMAVNMGPLEAHKLVQQAANTFSGVFLAIDGELGRKTIDAINKLCLAGNRVALLSRIRGNCRDHYISLISADPALSVFSRDWLARAQE